MHPNKIVAFKPIVEEREKYKKLINEQTTNK